MMRAKLFSFNPLFSMIITAVMLLSAPMNTARADGADDWKTVLSRANGQTVFWNAWGGSSQYNDFIAWVGKRVQKLYGVKLQHVKLSSTADAVRTVLGEKEANITQGSVDLIWINGANFNAMKEADLLFGPVVEHLPNFHLVNTQKNPATIMDFGVSTDGYETPWGMARLNFGYDSARLKSPPMSISALLSYARINPGRITYPSPPDFTGEAFLKQALLELSKQDQRLYAPVNDVDFAAVTKPLWGYLNAIRPYLWREGKSFPKSADDMIKLLNNNAIDLMMSYSLGAVSSAIARGDLPDSTRAYVFENGTLGNVNFVAIPFNSSAPEGAMVISNFLLSPEAQARRQHPNIWGDQTVLDWGRLSASAKMLFEKLPKNPALVKDIGNTLPEPHPSWTEKLRKEWQKRFAR